MIAENMGLIEMALVFGTVLGLAFFELWSVRRARKPRKDGGDNPGAQPPK